MGLRKENGLSALFMVCIFSCIACSVFGQTGNSSGGVFSGNWIKYKPSAGKNFYFSETAVTPQDQPFLTCMSGKGTNYIFGSRATGLYEFNTRSRLFKPVAGAGELSGKKITAVSFGSKANEIWAGTMFNGLYHRTEAGRWENFGQRDGLFSDTVTSILQAGSYVWVGTTSGLNRVVNSVVSQTSVKIQVFGMAYDKSSGRCYAGHSSSKLSVFDPASSRWSTVDMGVKPATTFNHLLVEPSGDILCGGFSGLFRVSARTGQVIALSTLPSQKLVSCLSMGEDGIVYVGLLGKRLGVHSLENGSFNNIFHGTGVFTQTNAVARNAQGEWILVSFGRLWYFTDKFVQDGTLAPVQYQGPSNTLNMQRPAFSSASSSSVGGSYSNSGGQGFDVSSLPSPPAGNQRTAIPAPARVLSGSSPVGNIGPPARFTRVPTEGTVLSICNTVSRIWAGTSQGRLYTITASGASTLAKNFNGPVTDLFYSSSGRLYIIVSQKDIHVFTGFTYKQLGTVPDRIQAICDDSTINRGGLWIGTDKGLYRFDGSNVVLSQTSSSFPDRNVTSLVADGDVLWVGTRLGLCSINQGQLTVYTTADGLPSKNILDISLLNGRLWVSTDDGIGTFSGRRFNVVNRFAAQKLSIFNGHVVAGSSQGITGFTNGTWSSITPLPGREFSSMVNTGTVVAVGLEGGVYILDSSKL